MTVAILAAIAICAFVGLIYKQNRLQREHDEAVRQRTEWRLRSLCRR
jgi:hypothetical protein